ncbi:4-hydroxythreonine-4-phosphate dehydrogenase PdxA ['Osedax' symbiont bacterium Rs2_46_30_T18]|nr:4-hydroxythreonine-4-phosphate dehydrogenase PdxA ['Osedax' symbiont bacterium Rs2_46_30_T18]
MPKIKRIAITSGEPAGIGPELIVKIAQHDYQDQLIVIADPQLLQQVAQSLDLPLKIRSFDADVYAASKRGEIYLQPVALHNSVIAGVLDASNSAYVIETLRIACTGCLQGLYQAMVTPPVHKGIINQAEIPFSGHTEFLQQQCNAHEVVMMLATEKLRVALVTTHLALNQVSQAITKDKLRQIIKILHADLTCVFGIKKPKILVCGLNPHAGEDGHMGMEEIDTIIPVLQEFTDAGMDLIGPLPADTLFTDKYLADCDAVLAMYHDQGLPVLKFSGFGKAVNITLGLPIIRTSVDHGTALDIAGSGQADCGSLVVALKYASTLANNRQL